MLKCSHLSAVLTDGTALFTDLSFTLADHGHIALIGEEGDGKSTLLKILAGETPDYVRVTGSFYTDWKMARLPQQIEQEWGSCTPLEYVLKESPETDIEPEDWNRCPELETISGRVQFDKLYSEQAVSTLSGGEKVRLMLVKVMMQQPDCFLLDEPANDLDLETVDWLESWLKSERRPVLMVSHDVRLINACADSILHLELRDKKSKPVWTVFHGSYDEYMEKRSADRANMFQQARNEKRAYEKQKARLNDLKNKVEGKLTTVSRQQPHKAAVLKKKMHAVQSSMQNLERTDRTTTDSAEEEIRFWLPDTEFPNGKKIIDESMCVEADQRILIERFHLRLYGRVRLGITGRNGCGKSQFLKKLYERLKEDDSLHVGWMPQNYDEAFNEKDTPITFLNRYCDDVTLLRTRLGSMNFTAREMEQLVFALSGGQKAKLILASLALQNCDVLLLDEPTRNLSPLSAQVLTKALKDCRAAVIIVSHDRNFLDELAQERVLIENKMWRKLS